MGIVKQRFRKTADSITKKLLSLEKDKKQIESLTDDVKQMDKETIKKQTIRRVRVEIYI